MFIFVVSVRLVFRYRIFVVEGYLIIYGIEKCDILLKILTYNL